MHSRSLVHSPTLVLYMALSAPAAAQGAPTPTRWRADSVEAYLGEAEARLELGESAEAREVLEAALDVASEDARVEALLARLREGG
ncbi:MAG: tetratricopeptide repeat protein [Gemmatimonadetes bacterium]|nr:tetratricopeptide repeat protein [Gemmatimonadota bacterium]